MTKPTNGLGQGQRDTSDPQPKRKTHQPAPRKPGRSGDPGVLPFVGRRSKGQTWIPEKEESLSLGPWRKTGPPPPNPPGWEYPSWGDVEHGDGEPSKIDNVTLVSLGDMGPSKVALQIQRVIQPALRENLGWTRELLAEGPAGSPWRGERTREFLSVCALAGAGGELWSF